MTSTVAAIDALDAPVRTDSFDYDLPESAIATSPIEPRDAARLFRPGADDPAARHLRMSDVADLVGPGDLVVVNDTRVLPARVRFRRPTGGSGEVLFLEERHDGWWEALVRPSAKLPDGASIDVDDRFGVEFGADLGDGRRLVRPHAEGGLLGALERCGEMPLPPYLPPAPLADAERYQTVYARRAASAAAPTAGLHFTPALLDEVRARGARVETVELIVGLGTFRPITADRVEDHEMHREHYTVPERTWAAADEADRVVAIGTTTTRALESAARRGLSGATDLFISAPFDWAVVDTMLTNFHLPRSSLLVMIDAFVGPQWRDWYAEALAEGYRFLSFGDAMWLERT